MSPRLIYLVNKKLVHNFSLSEIWFCPNHIKIRKQFYPVKLHPFKKTLEEVNIIKHFYSSSKLFKSD